VATDCDGIERDAVREYVLGELSLGEIDSRAHARVANSRCRGPYLANESSYKREFVHRTGGLAGIGLARASRKDRKVDPTNPSSYAVYASRSRLKDPGARLGVLITNAIQQVEDYWRGSVVLYSDEEKGQNKVSSSAIVWFRDEKVSRVMLNLDGSEATQSIKSLLEQTWGAGNPAGERLWTWNLDEHTVATLDLGPALSLTLADARSKAEATASAKPSKPTSVESGSGSGLVPPVAGLPSSTPGPEIEVLRLDALPTAAATPVATPAAAPAKPSYDRKACLRSCIAGCDDDAACERACAVSKCK
jgi:hypothetical protein